MNIQRQRITGVILAGGQSSRMQGIDKSFAVLKGKPLIEHVIERAQPQVDNLFINSNADPQQFQQYGLAVIADRLQDYAGPLAGLCTSMQYMQQQFSNSQWLALFPVDAPFLPTTLVSRLFTIIQDNVLAAAVSLKGVLQPTFSIWHRDLLPVIQYQLYKTSEHSLKRVLEQQAVVCYEWPAEDQQMLFNINTQQQLAELEKSQPLN